MRFVFLCLFVFFPSITYAAILQSTILNDVIYFIEDNSTEITRYSLSDEAYLAPIPLDAEPLAIHAVGSVLFVSYGTNIQRMNSDGTELTSFRTVSQSISGIDSAGSVLYLAGHSYIQSVNLDTGIFIDEQDFWYTSPDITVSRELNAIFVRSSGVSPSDINRINVDTSGNFGTTLESPYHGDYPGGSECFVFPGNRVTDTSGTIYNAADLTYSKSLGGYFTDLAFWNELPIVLRDQSLYVYNQAVLETGTFELALASPKKIAIYNDKIFVFPDALDEVAIVPVTEIDPADPAEPIDPTDLPYTPDETAIDKDGDTLYLLSKSNLNIFRWSFSQENYLESIPLVSSPQGMTYAKDVDRIYLFYPNGIVRYIDLNAENYVEVPFASAPSDINAIVAAGNYLIIRDASGAWGTFRVFDQNGEETFGVDWQYPTSEFAWSDTLKRIYYISGYSPSDLHYQDLNLTYGTLSSDSESPYHSSDGWFNPIRISETGLYIVLGSGRVVDSETLTELAWLGDAVYYSDVVWLFGNVFTLRGVDSDTRSIVERWQPDYMQDESATFEALGTPLGLYSFPSQDTLLLMTQVDNVPQFTKLNYTAGDFDNDGYDDHLDALPNNTNEWLDYDRDLIGDNSDPDDDNDQYADAIDAFPFNIHEWLDTDGDEVGNNADEDDDNDGVNDGSDAFPVDPTETIDSDNDGIGNNVDTDDDNDQYNDEVDAFPLDNTEWQDTDEDGKGNSADPDDDNDGVADNSDMYSNDPTRSSIVATEYLPLLSGNRWQYTGLNSSVTTGNSFSVNGNAIIPLEFPSGFKLYLKANQDQIFFYGIFFKEIRVANGEYEVDIRNNEGIPLFNSDYRVGTGTADISPRYGERLASWSALTHFLGTETIVVPAGEFETLHTSLNFNSTVTIDGQDFRVDYHALLWFAKDVGIVQIDEYIQQYQLQSFTEGSTTETSQNSDGGGGSPGHLMLIMLLGLLIVTRQLHNSN